MCWERHIPYAVFHPGTHNLNLMKRKCKINQRQGRHCLKKGEEGKGRVTTYSWPLDNIRLNCIGPFTRGCITVKLLGDLCQFEKTHRPTMQPRNIKKKKLRKSYVYHECIIHKVRSTNTVNVVAKWHPMERWCCVFDLNGTMRTEFVSRNTGELRIL